MGGPIFYITGCLAALLPVLTRYQYHFPPQVTRIQMLPDVADVPGWEVGNAKIVFGQETVGVP